MTEVTLALMVVGQRKEARPETLTMAECCVWENEAGLGDDEKWKVSEYM